MHITNLISQYFGKFAKKEFPSFLQKIINSSYVKLMKLDMSEFKKHSSNIAWDTEVWLMEVPDHISENSERNWWQYRHLHPANKADKHECRHREEKQKC